MSRIILDRNLAVQHNTTSAYMKYGLEELLRDQKLNIPEGYLQSALGFLKLARSYFSKGKVVNSEQRCAYRLASDAIVTIPEYQKYGLRNIEFDNNLKEFLEKAISLVESLSKRDSGELLDKEQIGAYRNLYRFYEGFLEISNRESDEEQHQRMFGELDADEDIVNPRRGRYSYS